MTKSCSLFFFLFFQLFLLPTAHAFFEGVDLVTQKSVTFDPKNLDTNSKAAVVVFLSAKCPCSKSHERVLRTLVKEFPDMSFLGVHSNADEDLPSAKKHFAKAQLPFPVIQDADSKIANELGALKTPHAFILDRTGNILFNGGVDESKDAEKAQTHFLANALTAVRAGKKPKDKFARTLGCVIKR